MPSAGYYGGGSSATRYELNRRRAEREATMASVATAGAAASGNEPSGGAGRRRPSASVEPSMCGTSWASVRWNRPTVSQGIGYRSSRFLGSAASSSFEPTGGSTTSSGGGRPTSPSPSTPRHRNFGPFTVGTATSDRYKRSSELDPSPNASSRPEYFYLTSRTPARTTLMDMRQNLRPVKKDSETRYSRPKLTTTTPFHESVKAYSSAYSAASAPPPASFTSTGAPPSSSSAGSSAGASAIVASSMAISNAMSQHRPIPKSERPWRQRLADAAQMRGKSAESGTSYFSSAYPISETASNILRGSRPYTSGGKSSALVALQQRKLQESAEQNLHEQLAELRSIVAEDKAASRFNRRGEASDAPSRRDSNASAFSIASRSSFGGSTASFGSSTLSCMPSAIRARQSVGPSTTNSLYASNIHPPYVSTMSKSYSPVRSSTVFQHSSDEPRTMLSTNKRLSHNEVAPLAAMEESTISNDSNDRDEKNIESTARTADAATTKAKTTARLAVITNRKDNSLLKSGPPSPAKVPAKSPAPSSGSSPATVRTIKVESESPADTPDSATGGDAARKRTVVKRVLRISAKRKENGEGKDGLHCVSSDGPKSQMVCEPTETVSQVVNDDGGLILKIPTDEKIEKVEGKGFAARSVSSSRDSAKTNSSKPESPVKSAAAGEDDERRYNAVAQFKPASAIRKKMPPVRTKTEESGDGTTESSTSSTAPVPGTWSLPSGENYISHNRHLKRQTCILNVEVICKHFLRENVSKSSLREASNALAKKIRRTSTKPDQAILPTNKLNSGTTKTNPLKVPPKPKKLANALAVLNCEFSNKKRFRLGIQKIIRPYGLKVEMLNMKCTQAKFRQTMLALNIVFRQQSRDATVKILSAASYIKVARAHANIRLPPTKIKRKSLMSAPNKENLQLNVKPVNKIRSDETKIADKEKERGKANFTNKITIEKKLFKNSMERNKEIAGGKSTNAIANVESADVSTDATVSLGQRPSFVKNTHIPYSLTIGGQQQTNGGRKSNAKNQVIKSVIPFVLPSETLLEEYVQRKRNELERSASHALNASAFNASVALDTLSQSSASASRCDSPPSVASSGAQITVQNYGANQYFNPNGKKKAQTTNQTANEKSLLKTDSKNEAGGKTPRITDSDLIENEKMIELLSYSSKPAILSNAVERVEKSMAPKFKPTASGNKEILGQQKAQQEKQQAPLSELARNLRKPVDVVKKVNVFDAPKSLFEERMQSQAAQLRRTSENRNSTTIPNNFPVVYEETADQSEKACRRLSNTSGDKQTVTQNFAAALASQQPRHSHERYAAHIPLSGRQSTTSVDSNNSGALDSASRSIDQMIDQARYRHHQQQQPPQNGKFKEAIDYLDQIFEDLRKECDVPSVNKNLESKNVKLSNAENNNPTFNGKANGVNITSSRTLPKNANRQSDYPQQQQQQPSFTSNGPIWTKDMPARPQEKSAYALPKAKQSQQQQKEQQSEESVRRQQSPKKLQQQSDANVAEAVALPKVAPKKGKENRLDFTRKWLVNDSKLWDGDENQPALKIDPKKEFKDDLTEELSDGSEHSVGSCSAEVAAINATEKRGQKSGTTAPNNKKVVQNNKGATVSESSSSKTTTTNGKVLLTANPKKKQGVVVVEPIRPQPYRPQPSQASGMGSSDYDLHKMSSSDKVNAVQFRSSSQNRASSQDYYSMDSTHSQEGIKPATSFLLSNSLQRVGSSTGAFVNYPQRGSIQSLPDAALMQQNNSNKSNNNAKASRQARQTAPDANGSAHPKLTSSRSVGVNAGSNFATELELDSLVAELELNTYTEDTSDKRRSFPTVQAEKHSAYVPASPSQAEKTVTGSATGALAGSSRTNSMGRRGTAPVPKSSAAHTIGAIAGNAASIGTVIGQAAINVQQYKQQRRQRLSAHNSSVSPTRRITQGNAEPRKSGMDDAESKRRQFHMRQGSGEKVTFNKVDSRERNGLAPTSYQSQQQQQQLQRKFSGGSTGSGSVDKASTSSNPFETINQERLKPSRVEAIQHMFEKSAPNKEGSSWSRKVSRQDSNKDESLYCEISDYKKDDNKADRSQRSSQRSSEKPKLRSVNIHPVFCQEGRTKSAPGETHQGVRFRKPTQLQLNGNGRTAPAPPMFTNAVAQPPTSAPPKRPPPPNQTNRGSLKLPTIVTTPAAGNGNGEVAPPLTPNANRHSRSDSLFGGRLSAASGSRAPSLNSATVDDEDDGFYDNIATEHHLSSSALSETGDNASMSSQQLPPAAANGQQQPHRNGGRQFIGKLIRRIGGMTAGGENMTNGGGASLDASRPPNNGGSVVSLNRVGSEKETQRGTNGLMKSNSLSHEPWKSPARLSTESVNMAETAQSDREDAEKGGFGNRLKQTIFGSKRRVAAHS